ncbi:hypothetical protein OMP43_17805 [Sphingomonas sp. CBMAI 2297]|uniref:hypothetical protein n=1 Tax=Sphingomonas sp. CBMAI 2297 TaxID=2991720 RepID=UPI00245454B2|nr:hypothetical protein [Sphingomonas sp. CBMAI 2297]MDH4745884.1 hypothetical protein [Sphingomonas sp. CBMAI 2297]
MRRLILAGAVGLFTLVAPAAGQARDVRAEQQRGIQSILTRMAASSVADLRSNCAAGDPAFGSAMLLNATRASFSLSVAQLCVSVLTRAGRDGTLRYVSLGEGRTTPASTFDTGFVSGYLKREQLPADAPTMAMLLPVADRCLRYAETNSRLCTTVGYVLGARAAHGETVPIS